MPTSLDRCNGGPERPSCKRRGRTQKGLAVEFRAFRIESEGRVRKQFIRALLQVVTVVAQ